MGKVPVEGVSLLDQRLKRRRVFPRFPEATQGDDIHDPLLVPGTVHRHFARIRDDTGWRRTVNGPVRLSFHVLLQGLHTFFQHVAVFQNSHHGPWCRITPGDTHDVIEPIFHLSRQESSIFCIVFLRDAEAIERVQWGICGRHRPLIAYFSPRYIPGKLVPI